MKKHNWLLLVLLVIIINLVGGSAGANQYWISYTGPPSDDYLRVPGGPKFLMMIDVLGNVLVGPQKIVQNSSIYVSPLGGATALSDGPEGKINMWFPSRRGTFLNPQRNVIYRAVIAKSNLNLLSLTQVKLSASNTYSMAVTQRSTRNFLVLTSIFSSPGEFRNEINAYSTTAPARSWFIADSRVPGDSTFNVSADGRAFIYEKEDEGPNGVYYQGLGQNGKPDGEPVLIARSRDVQARDVSNQLRGGRRYVLYNRSTGPLWLQIVDSKTGIKIGEPIRVVGSGGGQSVLDPRGRFVLYDLHRNRLMFQALDALGNLSGSRKLIADNFGGGLDILKD